MTKGQAQIIDWGEYVRPTKLAIKQFEFDEASFAICFGLGRCGSLVVIRDGHRTLDYYHPKFWDVIPGVIP